MTSPLVPVRLADLKLGEEFETTLSRRRGRVKSWGWTPWHDRAGRTTRLRAVLVLYGDVEVIHPAEMRVLVPADREHVRISDETRWSEKLEEPGSMGTLGQIARRVQ